MQNANKDYSVLSVILSAIHYIFIINIPISFDIDANKCILHMFFATLFALYKSIWNIGCSTFQMIKKVYLYSRRFGMYPALNK